jgi:hypothetical protein
LSVSYPEIRIGFQGFGNEEYKTMDIGRVTSSTTFLLKINRILGDTKEYNTSDIGHIYTLVMLAWLASYEYIKEQGDILHLKHWTLQLE